jgi:hypothetical protein
MSYFSYNDPNASAYNYYNSYEEENPFLSDPVAQAYMEQANQPAGPASQGAIGQVAGAAGSLGGMYLGNKALGGIGSLFGSSAAPSAVGTTLASNTPHAMLPTLAPIEASGAGIKLTGVNAANIPGQATGVTAALPYLGAAAGAYGLYDIANKWGRGDRSAKGLGMGAAQGAASGAALGSVVPGVGTALGAIIGGGLGLAGVGIKAGKHKDQKARDAVRSAMKENGFIDNDYKLQRSDGSYFDIGIDGKSQPYNVDFSKAGIGDKVAKTDVLAAILTGGDKKLTSDFSGYLTNAANSDADIKGFFSKAGIGNKEAGYNAVGQLQVDDQTKRIYQNTLNNLFGDTPKKKNDQGSPGRRPKKK